MHDPAGHYAVLGVAPAASTETVAAAFRAAARRVHPDVPETGDAAAFIRVREAYDVLGDPDRRAAYDRAAQREVEPETEAEVTEPSEARIPPEAWHRPVGLSFGLWAGAAVFAVIALAFGLGGLDGSAPHPVATPNSPAPPNRPPFPARPVSAAPTERTAPVIGSGTEGYILPDGSDTPLWRAAADGRYLPSGAVAPFTPIVIGRIDPTHGMAEIRTADGRRGFVAAGRIAPGDAAAAERARCIFDAGPPPRNNEILARHGEGRAEVRIENHRDQPAVVKLRDPTGAAVAAAFVAPRAVARIDRLPPGTYRPDVAYGELWSHACGRFVAGMRAQRSTGYQRVEDAPQPRVSYIIPPEDGIDVSDEEFRRD